MGEPITLDKQIASVAREIAMRRNVYPKWVASKRMKQEQADHEIAAMEAVIATLNAERWIPVTEKLPDDDVTVMIAIAEGDEPVWFGWHDSEGWHSVDATPLGERVTAWKQIPAGQEAIKQPRVGLGEEGVE